MANCHDRGGVTACVLYKDQFRKKKGDTKYNYPFRSFKSHLLLLLVPACSTYAQPAVRSFYQPLIRPCDISSKSDLSMEGGVQYEFFLGVLSCDVAKRSAMQLHDYQDETALSGRRVDFSSFAGKPVLFINVASE